MHLQNFVCAKALRVTKCKLNPPRGSVDLSSVKGYLPFLFNFISLSSAFLPQVLTLRGCALCYVSVYCATVSRAPQAERFLAHLDDPIMTGGN